MNKPLARQFQPMAIQLSLPVEESLLLAAQQELHRGAEADSNKCWGYFPGMSREAVAHDLPACQAFAAALPKLAMKDKQLGFNFLRMSLMQQHGQSPYHMDSDAATALTGNTSTIAKRLVWRLLLNLSEQHARTLGYLDADAFSIKLEVKGGYIHCPEDQIQVAMHRQITLPPRKGLQVQGVLFCASRVLHTGKDDDHGHFVAGYGYEEDV